MITDLDVGGAERALVSLATGLDRGRWQPFVVCLDGEGRLVEPLREAGIETRCLGVSRRQPLQAVARLAATLRARQPELVQSFLFHANIATRLAAPLAGAPWVVGGLRVAERGKAWHRALDCLTSRLSCGSVCVSEGVRQFSQTVGRLPADRLTVIPNGIDPAPFDSAQPLDRRAIGVPPDAFLTLYVGRLDPQKGLSTLLDAASVVAGAHPNWHLALVGDGPLRQELESQATRSPELADRVHWLGWRDDVPALLKTADLLVLPSLWEGMPNVVLEAMASCRAVVATAVEGTTELVVPGETGWLVSPGDAESLASALLSAAEHPELLRPLGAAARRRVESRFTLSRVVAAYDELWTQIV
ncbi:MAG TPA: glycosyltransferase [Isosphaeraceae bacterium]|nr:glycosyltransferase [Isosphaeraceae bacterium]